MVDADIEVKRFRPCLGVRDDKRCLDRVLDGSCTSDCSVKVPVTRYDFQEEEWKSVSRIILKGMVRFWLFSRWYCTDNNGGYLPPTEEATLKTACENFTEIDRDDLIDVLDSHNGRVLPTEQIIKSNCIEIAKQKELIHDRRFVFPDVVFGGQVDTILYLKKFIKEMDLQMLSNFMRFCTGSDLVVKDVDSISVTFLILKA
ncbi:hypothetical protein KUTeg_014604 [Tegillarca granosa]|uniref:Uncharacterized protein n=1 Tax=Tegillarca granosa TaxID=220873 RepID=A0ABQ9ERH0_TEGGR|nr:hypothetical protein KUTeg_014604 [Tegillarca granosa]